VDGLPDPPPQIIYFGAAVIALNCGDLIVEGNVTDLQRTTPIEFRNCGQIKFFGNQSPSGVLVQGYDLNRLRKADELETQIESAMVAAVFE